MGVFISDFAVRCALGDTNAQVGAELVSASVKPRMEAQRLLDGRETQAARIAGLDDSELGSRVNALLALLVEQLKAPIAAAMDRYGPGRVAVVIGGSNSGIDEGSRHLKLRLQEGAWRQEFRYAAQEMGDPAACAAQLIGAQGPAYAISTACTSGAKAMTAGARMLEVGLADAVVCGGADTLCDLTLNGFAALESIAPGVCNPFSLNRCGINIGEGGALFLLTREPGPWRLEGWGESSDAHHASAPDPTGAGAEVALRAALETSGCRADDIGFVHAHGTATRLNDQMEAALIHRVFGEATPAASTKPLTGHTLGAAGAVQAALCLLAMERGVYPPHLWDGARDPEVAPIRLSGIAERFEKPVDRMMSLSFAFGGSNMALVLGRG